MHIKLPEIISIGIYHSQYATKNKSISKKRKTSMFELELPMEDGGIAYINSSQKNITKNMFICAKPGQMRHTKFPFKCFYIHMIVTEGLLYNMLTSMPDFIEIKKYEKYSETFKNIVKYYDSKLEEDQVILSSLILELIYDIFRDTKKLEIRSTMTSSNYKMFKEAIDYINENLSSDLSLENIAHIAGLSPTYFHKFFKSATGETLRQYIEDQRIKKAANLLISTGYTLAKIAYDCGFSSQSYFNYAFKRKMKLTPREYAKNVFLKYETE